MRGAAALLLVAAAAGADEPPPEARAHYQTAVERFATGAYAEARAEFQRAYQVFPSPSLLFDLGQAARLAGDASSALDYYRRYLAERPAAPNRADVERLIAEVRAGAAPAPPPPDPRPRRLLLGLAIAEAALAAAACGAAAWLAVVASDDASQLGARAADGGAWTAADQARYDEGRTAARAAAALFAVAGLFVVGAAVAALVPRLERARVGIAPAAGGAALSLGFTF